MKVNLITNKSDLTSEGSIYFSMFSLLLVALLVYLPGWTSTFQLDDLGSVIAISKWGEITSFDQFIYLLFGDRSGPTGRPVAIFSFILHGAQASIDARPFLLTNTVIHLFNGFLLFLTVRALLKDAVVKDYERLALFSSVIWLLHPIHVSTVLYVVQRMAQLEMTFNLLAIISFLKFRKYIDGDDLYRSLWWVLALSVSSILAVCSKENAVLIPLQLLLVECFLLNGIRESSRHYRVAKWLLIYIPSVLVVGYLCRSVILHGGWEFIDVRRNFSIAERLLTQFRVVGDYLVLFFIPGSQSSGLYHDGYTISKGFFSPLSTSLWLFFHVAALFFAFIFKGRWKVLSFAVFWFYVNHLLESTVIPLEIKFEHRNYLPSMGLALLVAWLLIRVNHKIQSGVCFGLFFILVVTLSTRVRMWGDPFSAVVAWAEAAPSSIRANHHAGEILLYKSGEEDRARYFYRRAVEISNHEAVTEISFIDSFCETEVFGELRTRELERSFQVAPYNGLAGRVYQTLLDSMVAGRCPSLSHDIFERLILASLSNPKYQRSSIIVHLKFARARAELLLGEREKSMELFRSLLDDHEISIGSSIDHAEYLLSVDEPELAEYIISLSISGEHSLRPSDRFLVVKAQDVASRAKQMSVQRN